MRKYALNYLYLSKNHAGGKDQVGLNLLKGFYENNYSKEMLVICYDYSVKAILKNAPDIQIVSIKMPKLIVSNEFSRLAMLTYYNTFVLPKIIKKYDIKCIFHLSINNGLRKMKAKTIVLPHDIKQIICQKHKYLKIPLYKYFLYKILYFLDFNHADKIIAISKCDKDDIYECYPQFSHKVMQIYNPIKVNNITELKPMISDKYIIAVNLQFAHKNIITLIQAYQKIYQELDFKLVLVGNLPKRVQFLKKYVNENHLEEYVLFTGFVSDRELYSWLKFAGLYINPTLFEGFGMTAIEAMLLEVPVLVSKIPTNKETTLGLGNYYYPPDNIEELAQAIKKTLANLPDKKSLSKIKSKIQNEYSYKVISEKYFCLFKDTLNEA